jgi:hypothetical protein
MQLQTVSCCSYPYDRNILKYYFNQTQYIHTGSAKKMYTHFNRWYLLKCIHFFGGPCIYSFRLSPPPPPCFYRCKESNLTLPVCKQSQLIVWPVQYLRSLQGHSSQTALHFASPWSVYEANKEGHIASVYFLLLGSGWATNFDRVRFKKKLTPTPILTLYLKMRLNVLSATQILSVCELPLIQSS